MPHDQAYLLAEKKIEETLHTKGAVLDLRGFGLMELPDSLMQLKQLQLLNLSDNQLKRLPEWIGQLKQLQSLSLAHNNLEVIPNALEELDD